MKKLILIILLYITCIQPAHADCFNEISQSCYNEEKNKSDSMRYGATASEYCTMLALSECKAKNQSNNYTPKLKDIDKCEKLANKGSSWNKEIYHDCMGTGDGFRW